MLPVGRMCYNTVTAYEEEVFSHFMKTLFIPYIKSKYNEVNQNERKAENRCT